MALGGGISADTDSRVITLLHEDRWVDDGDGKDGPEETTAGEGRESSDALAWQRAKEALADLRDAYAALSGEDGRERALAIAAESLVAFENELAAAEAVGDGMHSSLAVKDRDLLLALEEIRLLRGERGRLESRARAQRTRIAELERLADTVFEDVELLLQSRRWRFGHALLSLPARLLGRGRPKTIADHIAELRREYQATAEEPPALTSTVGDGSSRLHGRTKGKAGIPRKRKQITVLVLSWDVGHNPLGRAYMLAEALQRSYTVVLAGFQFPRYGRAVWKPLRDAPFETVTISGSSFPDFQRTVDALARRIDADVLVACKARLPAIQLGLMAKACRNRPLLIDVDDYELGFFPNRQPLHDLSTVDPVALAQPFEEAWTRYTENLLHWADGLFVSNAALQERFPGVLVPHARDETIFDRGRVDRKAVRRSLGLTPDLRAVMFVGTPRPHKGVAEVLRAVKAANRPDFRFVIVGTPPDKPFEAELRALGGDTVRLLPDQPFDRLPEITAAADLVCLLQDPATMTARYQLPAKLVDAIAMGVPVLATDVPPLRGLIESGAIEAVTNDALTERILWWLDGASPSDRAAQVERGRATFERHFSYNAIHRTLYSQVERCLAASKPLPDAATAFLDSQAERWAPGAPVRQVARVPNGQTQRPTRHVVQQTRAATATGDGVDLVMFWKQGDVGIYGRRFDMLVRELARRKEIRRIAVFDAPASVYEVLREHVADTTVHHKVVAQSKLVRRWGLADRGKITHHVFLFDNRRRLPVERYPGLSAFPDFVARELAAVGVEPGKAVFWYYPVLDQSEELSRRFQPMLKIVDVVDDQRTWPDRSAEDRQAMTRHYKEVVLDADYVLANCEAVRDAMSHFGRDVALIPNGCDVDPPPPDPETRLFLRFSELSRPVLGLVGNLEGKTDVALLARIARERPDYQIALIGSTHTHADVLRLDEHPNVHFFGVVRYPEVKAWVKRFDVALLPHLDTDQTRSMHPLKLLVYAAAGVPVVSTRIGNLGEFEPFINVAEDHADFMARVDAVVEGTTTPDRDALAEVVARNAWAKRVDDIMRLLRPKLPGWPAA